MKIRLSHSEVELAQRQVMSLADAAGVRIVARGGLLWVTQDRDRRDVVLAAGESFVVDGAERVVVQALTAARVGLIAPPAEARAAAGRPGLLGLLLGGGGRVSAALAAA